MPVTLKLRFPAGRYHATPWGRHVNEGVAEWPPSPWRLLRALVAVWRRTLPELPEGQVKRVLVALADPPRFRLPPHRVAHTRHAMPMNVIARNYRPSEAERKAGKFQGDPSIVFDTFVAVGRDDPLYVHWPEAALTAEDEAALRRLASNLTSLGRAEGWVEAEVVSFPEGAGPPDWNCRPAEADDPNPVRVLCPDPDTAFAADHYPTFDPKKLGKGQVNPKEFLFACPRWHLCLDTETVHAERWPRVPGARWVNYTAPAPPPGAAPKPNPTRPEDRPTVARFVLDGPVLPPVTQTVRVAEAFRAAAMGQFGRWCHRHPGEAGRFRRTDQPGKFSSPTLAGKTADGAMRLDHRHAHYLPTAEDDGRRVTHLTVYAEEGFGPGEVAALSGVRGFEVPVGGGLALRAQLIGLGPTDLFRPAVGLFRESRVWESATPFVAHRHPKRRGTKRDPEPAAGADRRRWFTELALRELVVGRCAAPVAGVEAWEGRVGVRWVAFERGRARPGDNGRGRPHGGFRLTFGATVPGPVCLGYACHYGLGLFAPVPAADSER